MESNKKKILDQVKSQLKLLLDSKKTVYLFLILNIGQ